MTRAHGTLRAWAPLLDELVPETAGTLGPWLPRLAALIGPVQHRASEADGEPDGYSGFPRRGPPERLVMSEWALREVAPDEFLRRAAAGIVGLFPIAGDYTHGGSRDDTHHGRQHRAHGHYSSHSISSSNWR